MKQSLAVLSFSFLLAGVSQASLIPSLSSGPTATTGGYSYTYTAQLSADEALSPSTTAPGVASCPAPGNTLQACNPAGTFLTLYDFYGFVSVTAEPAGFYFTTQNQGITPSTINSGSFDSTTVTNVTFFYTGAFQAGLQNFNFTLVSTSNSTSNTGEYAFQATKNTGPASGTTDQGVGTVTVPIAPAVTTPEPASLALLGMGLVGLAVAGRKFSRR